jgi:predicted Rossmann fold flavoprotein
MLVDVIVLGAGGAGMMCAIHAGRRGRRVLLLDHAAKLGGKILISGGGRCNFTNTGASPAQYVSQNVHFYRSALTRYPPETFIQMVRDHGIAFHEKKLGQLFCDGSASQIVELLKAECDLAGARFELGCEVGAMTRLAAGEDARFSVETSAGTIRAHSLVVATGGLSIPKTGATGLGYDIARQCDIDLVARRPALDGFTFAPRDTEFCRELAGVSVDSVLTCNGASFRENILFTHAGLSGPAALQGSLYWNAGDEIAIDLLPGMSLLAWLLEKKAAGNRSLVKNLLSELLPARVADRLCERFAATADVFAKPLPQIPERTLESFCESVHRWTLVPSGTVGYNKAEVTKGGVDTDELSSKTMEAKKVPGLYFIGEVVDVTGWLGGYNFQWAWASGWAAGQVA